MSKSNTTENDVLKMILKGELPSWSANSSVYVSLHTGDPGEGGTALTSEADYGGYTRATVNRASGWIDGGSSFSNAALIQFPQCTGGTNTISFVSIVSTGSGAGQIYYSGELNAHLTVANLIQPQFSIGALIIEED